MPFEDKVMPHNLSMLASAKQRNWHMSLHKNIIWSLIWCTAFDVNNKRYMPVYFIHMNIWLVAYYLHRFLLSTIPEQIYNRSFFCPQLSLSFAYQGWRHIKHFCKSQNSLIDFCGCHNIGHTLVIIGHNRILTGLW